MWGFLFYGHEVLQVECADCQVQSYPYKHIRDTYVWYVYFYVYYVFCGVLRRYVSQNIVAITGNLRLNRFTLFYVFN